MMTEDPEREVKKGWGFLPPDFVLPEDPLPQGPQTRDLHEMDLQDTRLQAGDMREEDMVELRARPGDGAFRIKQGAPHVADRLKPDLGFDCPTCGERTYVSDICESGPDAINFRLGLVRSPPGRFRRWLVRLIIAGGRKP